MHFGNGTADVLAGDKDAFFASVHLVHDVESEGGEQFFASDEALPPTVQDEEERGGGVGGRGAEDQFNMLINY